MVIIYENKTEAEALCFRMLCCKSESDENYTSPIEKSTGDKWAVQINESDENMLTQDEGESLQNLPADWFDEI